MMRQQMLVLSALPYALKTESGEVLEGISVHYIPKDNLDPTEDGTLKGVRVGKISLPITKREKIASLPFPALYDTTLEMALSRGKMELKIVDIELVGTITLTVNKK